MDQITTDRLGIGGNNPPLADQLALAFSPIQLAKDFDALGLEVQAFTARAGACREVDSDEANEVAASLVIEARELASRIDATRETVKAPVLTAGRNVDAFFNGLNNSDPRKAGAVTGHKIRIERLKSGYAFQVAERERQRAREAADALRRKAEEEAAAAAAQEAAARPAVAEVLIDQSVATEQKADIMAAMAQGPVQEVARQRTSVATTGLRAVPGFEITDRAALKTTLGPLGDCFTLDAILAAIRKFRTESETLHGKFAFRDDDQHAQKRVVVAKPDLPGVEFFITYEGSTRA